jgi:hypothetical protein
MSHPPLYAWIQKIKIMHSTETINQFLNLRVQGWSFARIAEQLHVSKPTLLDWNRKHQSQIESMKAVCERSLHENLQLSRQQELEKLNMFHNALRQELVSRSLKSVPTEQIEALANELQLQIEKVSGKEKSDTSNGK